jgi:DNA-binding XRE family transcriptional regulator
MHSPEEKIIIALVKHFKTLRLQQGLSHSKLATLAGITRPAISQIESGKRTPTIIVCLKIAHALGERLGEVIARCEREIYKSTP